MNSFDCSNHTAPQNKMMKDKMDRTVVSRLGLHTINREWDETLIYKRAFTESEVKEDLLLVIIIAACENNLSDGTEVAQILKISFAILDKFLKEFSSVFHHSKMSTSTGAWSNLVCDTKNGLLTNIVLKRALAASQCVFIIDDRTQSTPIQSVVDVEAISSSTCIISNAPAAGVLDTVVDPLGRIHSFTFPAQLDSVIWCFTSKPL
uniref:Uncharacterized protein n=1 Tax=Rhodnius prolixus TaxID=13249 RepID=T1HTE1_RHOPR